MVVPYQYSTSNRNRWAYYCSTVWLFLINILHQTATGLRRGRGSSCCSLSIFYIKPQPVAGYNTLSASCSLSIFYIKPQRGGLSGSQGGGCSLSIFYIKPQLRPARDARDVVVPYQYSTSNRNNAASCSSIETVVPYQYSTSNRNRWIHKYN